MLIQITLATLLVAGSSGVAQTRPAITKSASASTTATIQAIDSTMRTITLRDAKGQEDTFTLGPDVKRFDELKVGDTVKFTYYESIVLQVRKPGDVDKGAMTSEIGVNPSKGATPGGTLSAQDKMTVTIKSIDPVVPSLTVTTPAGRTVTRKVDDPKNIEGLKPGDQITITYTRALVTSIERQK
jgi:Cu/Ag efflux protein CusF